MKRLLGVAILGLAVLAVGGCLEFNKTPVAAFTRSPASGVAPLAVFFDATESLDPDGAIASYEWEFGDGVAADGVTATHTFETAGTYSVALTVTDDRGKTAETIRNVDVTASDAPPPEGTEIGQRAPGFSLPNVRTERDQSLADFRGYVVLLEFWRSTCSACRSSMPAIESLRAKYAADGLLVVLVSQDVTAEEARVVLDGQGYDDFIGLFDGDEAARNLYDVELIPRMFVIDRQGIVRYVDHPVRIRDRNITPWL
jgi:peroxiredoxin